MEAGNTQLLISFQSDFSEVITLVREPELIITKPPQLSSPAMEGFGRGAIRVSWTAPKIVVSWAILRYLLYLR